MRLLATNTFATLIKLVPLDGSVPEPENLPLDMSRKKADEKRFLDQLTNISNLEPYNISVKVGSIQGVLDVPDVLDKDGSDRERNA